LSHAAFPCGCDLLGAIATFGVTTGRLRPNRSQRAKRSWRLLVRSKRRFPCQRARRAGAGRFLLRWVLGDAASQKWASEAELLRSLEPKRKGGAEQSDEVGIKNVE